MAKDPAFLFYSQDFIVGVQTMSFEDRGKYITLLATMHQSGRLKETDIKFIVGEISEKLRSKFLIDQNGYWFNKRLEEEAKKRNSYTKSRRINGSKGGRPKKGNFKGDQHKKNHMDIHMGNEIENVNDNEEENENEILSNEKSEFEKVRKLYPGTKRGLDTEFKNLQNHKDWKSALPILLGSLDYQIHQKNLSTGFTPGWPHFQTWINQRRWEEEIFINQCNIGNNGKLNTLEQETINSIRNQN